MKKKTVITASTLLLLTVDGVTALNVINPSWRKNTIFATARDKQLAWLKEHEEDYARKFAHGGADDQYHTRAKNQPARVKFDVVAPAPPRADSLAPLSRTAAMRPALREAAIACSRAN